MDIGEFCDKNTYVLSRVRILCRHEQCSTGHAAATAGYVPREGRQCVILCEDSTRHHSPGQGHTHPLSLPQ
jgi:hypothetical protein